MADVSVRPARADDADAIGQVQVATWQQAYAAIIPPEILSTLTPAMAAAAWHEAVTHPPTPAHRVLVAHEQDRLVGFVALVPDDEEATIEVGPLLVEPRWGRRGHGSRLLAAAVDHARGDGMTTAVAWLPETDAASLAFFTSAGWARDGLVRGLDAGDTEVREIRLHVSLEE